MELLEIARHFDLDGYPGNVTPYGTGHIHDTYALEAYGTFIRKYILQRVNHLVFKDPEMVQNNISKVLNYLHYQVPSKRWNWITDLQIVSNVDGSLFLKDEEGAYWRCFRLVHNSHILNNVDHPAQAYEGALAYGHFLARLDGFDASQLGETIPAFRDIKWRIEQFEQALSEDSSRRKKKVEAELGRVKGYESIPREYLEIVNFLPHRVAHNDTKISNVLMDNTSHRVYV